MRDGENTRDSENKYFVEIEVHEDACNSTVFESGRFDDTDDELEQAENIVQLLRYQYGHESGRDQFVSARLYQESPNGNLNELSVSDEFMLESVGGELIFYDPDDLYAEARWMSVCLAQRVYDMGTSYVPEGLRSMAISIAVNSSSWEKSDKSHFFWANVIEALNGEIDYVDTEE